MYGGWSVKEENILTDDVRFNRSTVTYVKQYHTESELNILQHLFVGWDSVVGIATCYRMDGLGIESQ
jgi:hypothetical protein